MFVLIFYELIKIGSEIFILRVGNYEQGNQIKNTVDVLRNGSKQQIEAINLLPGDIIYLK
jgi:magnesium-transporting ATPase (P-type)